MRLKLKSNPMKFVMMITCIMGASIPSYSAEYTPFANINNQVNSQTASYSLTTTDDTVLFTTGASNLTATLPTAVNATGKRYTIKKVDSGSGHVAINTTLSQTVDGQGSGVYLLPIQYDFITVESDGSNWNIVALKTTIVAACRTTPTTTLATNTQINYGNGSCATDTYAAVTTGATWKFTAPLPGTYRVSATLSVQSVNPGAGTNLTLRAQKNGTSVGALGAQTAQTSSAMTFTYGGTMTIQCAAGDTIDVRNYGASVTPDGTTDSGVYIERIGP